MRRRLLFLLPILAVAGSLEALDPPTSGALIAGRLVSVTLVDAATLAAVEPAPTLRVSVHRVKIGQNMTISGLLVQDGVVPDTDAFAVVYDLNPGLSSLEPLTVGRSIEMPFVEGLQHSESVRLAMLTVDMDLRSTLCHESQRLADLQETFAALPLEHFASDAARHTAVDQLSALTVWSTHVCKALQQRTAPPLRHLTLQILCSEIQTAIGLATAGTSAAQPFTDVEQYRLAAIHSDVERLIAAFDDILAGAIPSAEVQREVLVRIICPRQRSAADLRVYFTLQGLYRSAPAAPFVSYAFDRLGSGNSQLFPLKDFVFWVAQDGRPVPPVSPPLVVRVRNNNAASPLVVDLRVAE